MNSLIPIHVIDALKFDENLNDLNSHKRPVAPFETLFKAAGTLPLNISLCHQSYFQIIAEDTKGFKEDLKKLVQ